MWLLRGEKAQNEEHFWKEWVTLIETWQQYCAFRKIEDEAYRDVAMATILAPSESLSALNQMLSLVNQ